MGVGFARGGGGRGFRGEGRRFLFLSRSSIGSCPHPSLPVHSSCVHSSPSQDKNPYAKAIFEAEQKDLLDALYECPQRSCDRKINEFVKRVGASTHTHTHTRSPSPFSHTFLTLHPPDIGFSAPPSWTPWFPHLSPEPSHSPSSSLLSPCRSAHARSTCCSSAT